MFFTKKRNLLSFVKICKVPHVQRYRKKGGKGENRPQVTWNYEYIPIFWKTISQIEKLTNNLMKKNHCEAFNLENSNRWTQKRCIFQQFDDCIPTRSLKWQLQLNKPIINEMIKAKMNMTKKWRLLLELFGNTQYNLKIWNNLCQQTWSNEHLKKERF